MSIAQNILDAISILAKVETQHAGYDKTIQAQILSCEDASIGRYRCRYQDSTIYAYNNTLNTSYNKGDYVYILVPSGDMNKEKTILGTSNRLGSNFISNTSEEDKYDTVGNNIITSTRKYYLNTANSGYSYDIYDVGSSDNKISLDTESIASYFKESTAFKVTMMIKTAIPVERQSRGSYGLIFTLRFKDNTLKRNVSRTYIVNEDSMSGNPYNYKNNTKQTVIFKIDGENFVDIQKITLFNNSFPGTEGAVVTTGDLPSGDIAISALTLCGLAEIDKEANQGVTISFDTPSGTILTSSVTSLPLTAKVKVDGRVVSSSQNLKFYWGIEDAGITPSLIHYNNYLGGGWRCLNESNTINSGSTVDWVPNTGTFIYTKTYDDALLTKDNRLRVAVVFNNNTYINELVIHNNTKSSDIVITSDSGTVFYYDKGTPTLTCNISGGSGTYSYQWGQQTNTGVFKTISSTTNVIKNAAMKTVTDFVKVKCSVYLNTIFKGTATITLANSLKQDQLSLIDGWDGKTVQINEDSILSPRVGAGKKDDNGFTGVIMGVLKEYPENVDTEEIVEKVGLFGYSNSQRSFFLNSANGSAVFGAGRGRLAIDPSHNQALIYSSNFWQQSNLDQDGFPINYKYRYPDDYSDTDLQRKLNPNLTQTQGMLINLTEPEIVYGSGNFSVDAAGKLSAKNVNVTGKIVTSSDPIDPTLTSTQLDAGTMSIWYRKSGTAATPTSKIFEIVVVGTQTTTQTALLANPDTSQGLAWGVPWPDPGVPGINYIITDYRYNVGQADIEEGCRHKFIGKIKFYEDQSEDRPSPKTPDTTLMEVNGNAKITGSLQVDSLVIANGTVVSGDQSYSGNLVVSGNITSSTGKITVGNGLDVSGASILRGAATLNSTLTVVETSTFRDNVNILGDKSLQWGGKNFLKYVTLDSDASNYGLYVGATDEKLFLQGSNITSNIAISTSSDERKKISINSLDERYIQLMREINPVSFKYKAENNGDLHTGFIAQDVQVAMQKCGISNSQLAAFVDINKNGSEYALRYEEFISPMLLYIKSLEKQIELLKQKVGI